jgi:hypothetical protein
MAQVPRRRPATKRDLLRLDLRHSTPEQLADTVQALLDQSSASAEERVHLLASAFVVEALRPYWTGDRTPQQAHDALCREDPELAAAIEALAPMLLGRAEVREVAHAAIASVEALLGLR